MNGYDVAPIIAMLLFVVLSIVTVIRKTKVLSPYNPKKVQDWLDAKAKTISIKK